MIKLTLIEQKAFQLIASFYGCEVRFVKHSDGGFWYGDWLEMGISHSSVALAVSIFCHELAHFHNWKTGKFPQYHNIYNHKQRYRGFKNLDILAREALKAELYTEKIGKVICQEWFPSIKYVKTYKNNQYYLGLLYGFFMRNQVRN